MNEVCEMYEDVYPDMNVQTLAYWHTLKPPVGLKAHKNVVVQYCTISSCYNHSLGYKCYFNGIEGEQIAGWANVADELYCWDYAWNWAFHAVPYPILSYADVMEKHQWLYENNVRLMFQNCGGGRDGNFQQVCSYMYNLAIWNPYMSEDLYYEHMMDACLAFYGDGGKYVYDAMNLLEEKYDRCLISEQTPSAALMHMYMKNYIDEIISKMESARLLAEAIVSFNKNCAVGIKANKEKMHHNLHNSLMLVTALNPYIGYENAAKTAKKAYKDNISLKQACIELGFLTEEKFDEVFHPEKMV
jgi:hypothetical protein